MVEQIYKKGTRVTFMIKGMAEELIEEMGLGFTRDEFVRKYGNKECTVLSLETYTELGNVDHEYYNVKFNDGLILQGVSGYHLHKIVRYGTRINH